MPVSSTTPASWVHWATCELGKLGGAGASQIEQTFQAAGVGHITEQHHTL
jgi:hypothetical protein